MKIKKKRVPAHLRRHPRNHATTEYSFLLITLSRLTSRKLSANGLKKKIPYAITIMVIPSPAIPRKADPKKTKMKKN